MNVLRTRKYSICMPPDLMKFLHGLICLLDFLPKKKVNFFLFKKKTHSIEFK